MHSVGRRRHAAAVAGLACCLIAGPGLPAGAVPGRSGPADDAAPGGVSGPSAEEVAKARALARERGERLGETTVMVAEARARQEELIATAERLVEAYNGELVKTARAKKLSEQAAERARTAASEVAKARGAVAAITAQSYGGLDIPQPMMAMMTGGGPADDGYLRRASILAHMGGGQAETLKQLRESQEVFAILKAQAEEAYARQQETRARAEEAKQAAEAAIARQIDETRRIEEEQARLESLADEARSAAEKLAREREVALEAARIARENAERARYREAAVRREAARVDSGARWSLNVTTESARGDIAADWALTQLDKPYVWAAAGPSAYDCSGLTMRAWERVGIVMDHWTGTQWTSGPHVRLSELRRGDLLFYGQMTGNPGDIHHVGLYIGRGLMVHAPQTGDVVRVAPMWRSDLIGATRPA